MLGTEELAGFWFDEAVQSFELYILCVNSVTEIYTYISKSLMWRS